MAFCSYDLRPLKCSYVKTRKRAFLCRSSALRDLNEAGTAALPVCQCAGVPVSSLTPALAMEQGPDGRGQNTLPKGNASHTGAVVRACCLPVPVPRVLCGGPWDLEGPDYFLKTS